MLAYLILGVTYGFSAAVTPGPLSMFLISQSLTNGRRRALPVAFSPLLSDGPIALIILSILSQVPPRIVVCLRVVGGAFILYLAFAAWRAWRNFDSDQTIPTKSAQNGLLKAALINWLNPNPYIGWSLIMGPNLLAGWRISPANGIAFVASFYMILIASMIGMVFLFAAAKSLGQQVQRILTGISAVGLACFGLYQFWLVIG
jgi:threonine/homoserine/homoserine lactone efflux protein